jgi:glutamine synthetase
VGDTLEQVLNQFEGANSGKANTNKAGSIKIPNIPEILLDNTDRNRTSPFAFTGNKFEFRAVGSSDNCASSMTVLNTIVGHQLNLFKQEVDALLKSKKTLKKEDAIKTVLRGYLKESQKVLFGGNGYSEEWVKEAKRRGLNNIKSTPKALEAYLSKSSFELFVKNGIFTHKELEARTEIRFENYILRLQIEGRVMNEMVENHVIPAAINYQKRLADNVKTLLDIGQAKSTLKAQTEIIAKISDLVNKLYTANNAMTAERAKANKIDDAHKRALAYCDKVKPLFDEIREYSDSLESIVDDQEWPFPKYRDLLNGCR